MAYLGIYDGELKGLYYFSSISMGESIATQIEGCAFYQEREKKKAMLDFSVSKSEIKDGRILMEKFKNTLNDMAYIGLKGTPFDGVYSFKRKVIRDREAKYFPNAILSMDKEEMLTMFNISESDIKDGGFLMGSEVRAYRAKMKKLSEKESKGESISSVADISENKVTPKTVISNSNLLRDMISAVSKGNDVVELVMSTGEKYRIALRKFFYMETGCSFENCAYVDTQNNVQLKEKAVNALIDSGEIVVVEPTEIKYGNGFVVLRGCDDAYSPDVHHNKMGNIVISHSIPEIILNVGQIVSVVGFEHYTEINLTKITEEKNKLVYTYLVNKFCNAQ